MLKSKVIWNPLLESIQQNVEDGEGLALIASPFIKLAALQELFELPCSDNISVIVRWRPEDLIAGVSDLVIYPYLKNLNIPLYLNNDIHLKLILFDTGCAYCGSGNVTGKGLGLADPGNIEIGYLGRFSVEDHLKVRKLCDASRLVTDEVYGAYKKYLDQYPVVKIEAPPIELPAQEVAKEFLVSCLPASKSPEDLYRVYSDLGGSSQDEQLRAISDICNYQIPENLAEDDFIEYLGSAFSTSPFIVSIVDEIRSNDSMRFGAVNAFIHHKCEDVPLPYRWELKERTNRLYNWLCRFHDDLEWHVPGARSQVIYVK